MAAGSPYFADLDLPESPWVLPEIDCAHPLDDGDVVLLRARRSSPRPRPASAPTMAGGGRPCSAPRRARSRRCRKTSSAPSPPSHPPCCAVRRRCRAAPGVDRACFRRGANPCTVPGRRGPRVPTPRPAARRRDRRGHHHRRTRRGVARRRRAEPERSPRPSSPGSVSVA